LPRKCSTCLTEAVMAATCSAPDSAVSSTTVQVQSLGGGAAIFQAPGGGGAGGTKQQYLIVNQAGAGLHSTGGGIQIVSSGKQEREESVKRHEILARQPSYCKILNDLKEAESSGSEDSDRSPGPNIAMKGEHVEVIDAGSAHTTQTVMINGQQYQIVSPAAAMENVHTINLNNPAAGGGVGGVSGGTVQYTTTTSQNGQTVFLPAGASAGVVTVASQSGGGQVVEEAARKREIRLLKNREAARECRNKKKEYIKCLENRVAVLENQNKALIEELKSLKELYTGQKN